MKKILFLFVIVTLGLASCKKEYPIYSFANIDQCLTPVEVKTKVQYMNVTFDMRVFPDAEAYYVEIYSTVPDEGTEPDPAALIDHFEIAPKNIPYTYAGPEDQTCYYRIKATSSTRKDSRWATGSFMTDTDPSTTCSKPVNLKINSIWDMVTFTWDIFPNTTIYELEVYSDFIPNESDPDPATLVTKVDLTPAQIPDTLKFAADTKYYFRVRSTAPGTELKSSKWVKGTFETTAPAWPTDDKALNVKTTQNYAGTDDNGNPTPFTGGGKANTEVITLNGFTYGVKGMYYGNRITLPSGAATDVNTEYGASIPTKNYMSFKICKPGTIETYFTRASDAAPAEACVVLLTNKVDEGLKSKIIFKSSDLHPAGDLWSSGKPKDVVTIKEGDMYGILEAATVYVFASNQKGLHVFQMTWTPSI